MGFVVPHKRVQLCLDHGHWARQFEMLAIKADVKMISNDQDISVTRQAGSQAF